jgi:hypothetical protein
MANTGQYRRRLTQHLVLCQSFSRARWYGSPLELWERRREVVIGCKSDML